MNGIELSVGQPAAFALFPEPHAKSVPLRFSRNERIYSEDDEAHYWYKVVSGTVRACNLLADGRRHIGAFFFAGDFFGFDDASRYLFSTEAVTEATLARYPRALLKQLPSIDPVLARQLHGTAAQSVAQMCRRMTLLARKTSVERVASFLLEMADRADCGNRIELPMTRHDIADHLGLTFETICRVISSLKKSGLIRIPENAHQIDLVDYPALKAMQEGSGAEFSV